MGSFLRGLNASVTGNAQAFGFSITVTVTFGVVSADPGCPGVLDLFAFALAAVLAFSLLNLAVVALVEDLEGRERQRALLVGTATDFLAVGAAVAAAVGCCQVTSGWVAWGLAPFAAATVYVLVQSLELAGGESVDEQ